MLQSMESQRIGHDWATELTWTEDSDSLSILRVEDRTLDLPGGSVVKNPLPMQEPGVQSQVGEDPTCPGAAKAVCHNSGACVLEPGTTTAEPSCPAVHALQQEKPPPWEAHTPQCESSPRLPQLEKSPHTAVKTQHSHKQISYIKAGPM